MLTDKQLYVILKSFYRPTDGVLVAVVRRDLVKYSFHGITPITDAIDAGILQRITPIRLALTDYGQRLWLDAKKRKVF